MGSSPATMEAAKGIDAFGCMPGNHIEQADAEQAYVQADLKGPPLWISLPTEAWPKAWEGMSNPVCLMKKALYGHPDSGSFWEQHCKAQLEKVGFKLVANWNSCFKHEKLKLFLLVYVDDFKLAGPKKNLANGWKLIKSVITIDEPRELNRYLGCDHEKFTDEVGAQKFSGMKYCMTAQLTASIELYDSECAKVGYVPSKTGKKTKTPFVQEQGSDAPAAQPMMPDIKIQCPRCKHIIRTGKMSRAVDKPKEEEKGLCGGMALKVLMKVMYIARLSRFDLLRPVSMLAREVNRWSPKSDKKLEKLVAYIRTTVDVCLYGYIGDPAHQCSLELYSDADFAGLASQHSTTGGFLVLTGKNTWFPLAAVSKKQTSVSTSTAEAELTALFYMVRNLGLPGTELWSTLLDRKVLVDIYEDNQAVLQIVRTGKNMTMRHFERTHRVPVAWLHELYDANKDEFFRLHYAKSDEMVADLFTKAFTDICKFEMLKALAGIGATWRVVYDNVSYVVGNRGQKDYDHQIALSLLPVVSLHGAQSTVHDE